MLLQRVAASSDVFSVEEALLVVEVADTSLRYDRDDKLPVYAAAGVPEAWIVSLKEDLVEVYADPGARGYGTVSNARRGDRAVSPTVPDLAFEAAEILPPGG